MFSRLTTSMARMPENAICTLRCLQVLQKMSNHVTQRNIVPTTTTIQFLLCVCNNYAVLSIPLPNADNILPIVYGKMLGIMVSALFTIVFVLVSNITGNVARSYVKTVGVWKNKKLVPCQKKVLKSLRPDGVKIAFFGSVQRMTALNVVMIIIKYTGRLLISFKGKIPQGMSL